MFGCAGNQGKTIYYWDKSYVNSMYENLKDEGNIDSDIKLLEDYLKKIGDLNRKFCFSDFCWTSPTNKKN